MGRALTSRQRLLCALAMRDTLHSSRDTAARELSDAIVRSIDMQAGGRREQRGE
jgi:hypothetical protein